MSTHIMPGANIIPFKGVTPTLGDRTFVCSGAQIIGDVVIGEESSVWFNVTIRGDVNFIRIGKQTNVQDNTVIHVTRKTAPTHIGDLVTIGHGAVLHGCTIDGPSLIGMGAILLDGCKINADSMVAAGALVSPGKEFPAGSLIMGSPAKVARPLTSDEKAFLRRSAANYCNDVKDYLSSEAK